MLDDMTAGRLIHWFHQMLEIRAFEDRVHELFMEGLIAGTTHSCQGQEAVCVGTVAALQGKDQMTITYRGHGQALARGMSPDAAFAELMGRASGCCRGLGGSMHLTDFSLGLIGSFAIVGAGLPVAVGAALSSAISGRGAVAMSFCGDGATNIGTFHEALNMAAVWKAPVVFIVENNLYGEYSPIRDTTSVDDLALRARAYGIPGAMVDGQDVRAVYEVTNEAVIRARSGNGPTLIEAKTYRFRGHSRSDPGNYRPTGELERWKEQDPILVLGRHLVDREVLSAEDQVKMREEVTHQIDDSSRRAADGAFPTLDDAKSCVYAPRSASA
jgi:TPP-dependent pyruvate/acetoin dehydrogenase alpha subunit